MAENARPSSDGDRPHFDPMVTARSMLQRASTRRQDLRDQSWREFWRDLGLRFLAVAAVVAALALVLWLLHLS